MTQRYRYELSARVRGRWTKNKEGDDEAQCSESISLSYAGFFFVCTERKENWKDRLD